MARTNYPMPIFAFHDSLPAPTAPATNAESSDWSQYPHIHNSESQSEVRCQIPDGWPSQPSNDATGNSSEDSVSGVSSEEDLRAVEAIMELPDFKAELGRLLRQQELSTGQYPPQQRELPTGEHQPQRWGSLLQQLQGRTWRPLTPEDVVCRFGGCTYISASIPACNAHRDTHFDVRRYECPGCGQRFKFSSLRAHLRKNKICAEAGGGKESWTPEMEKFCVVRTPPWLGHLDPLTVEQREFALVEMRRKHSH
ncbi:hypothetical protein GLOTRDRAFT_94389 [Gloeophyllum trabeum ATCC 11539]|uniref:C2H2-type domain-containing protein n=1 Tax=Gloeophyllum trabeum (strain ATCC 11539 / FP-39264 / Madison 617) TaxID=670483 RepID=S7Q1W9_GLOTA|nr:uncharacterized protein GLOTRDRAFT_94389 [Gloeophyllum trabeum ATCC 11539]EPQ53986.1 hypothetical protein GLOTRDRAFT_94389 [Gloeophyllum trabeum ATCC 11539]